MDDELEENKIVCSPKTARRVFVDGEQRNLRQPLIEFQEDLARTLL